MWRVYNSLFRHKVFLPMSAVNEHSRPTYALFWCK